MVTGLIWPFSLSRVLLTSASLTIFSGTKYTFLYLSSQKCHNVSKVTLEYHRRDLLSHFCLVRESWNGLLSSLCLIQVRLQMGQAHVSELSRMLQCMVSFPEWYLKARAIPANFTELQLLMSFREKKKGPLEFEKQFNVILRRTALAGLLCFGNALKGLGIFFYE